MSCCATRQRRSQVAWTTAGLTRGGREQYDSAKGFTEEAEKALKERNFVYAQTAADKAAKLAANCWPVGVELRAMHASP